MPTELKGWTWIEREITDPTDGWEKRYRTGTAALSNCNVTGDWNRINNNRISWEGNKAADRWNNYFPGSPNTVFPSDQSGKYDPRNAAEKLRDASFYYLIKSFTPSTVSGYATIIANANAGKQAVIAEILNNIVDGTYNFTSNGVTQTVKIVDWLGTPVRWKLGGMSDVNPSFIIAEWVRRVILAWDYSQHQATDAQKAKFNAWLIGAGTVIQSWYIAGYDNIFTNWRTGTPGSWTIKSNLLAPDGEEWTGVDSKNKSAPAVHYNYKKAKVIARFTGNRRRNEICTVGLIGLITGNQTFLNNSKQLIKGYFAYSVYPDLSYVDFLRSHDTDSAGNVKASHGYSYSIPEPIVLFGYVLALNGDTSILDWETTGGTSTADSNTNGNTSDGVTVKGLRRHIDLLIDIHNGVVNRYSEADPTKRIGAIDNSGKENVTYFIYNLSHLYYQTTKHGTFLGRNIPSSRQPNGPANEYTTGGLPGVLSMYRTNVALNRFVVEEQPEDPGTPKIAVTIDFPDQPDRVYVPNQIITFTATLKKPDGSTVVGVTPTISLVDAAGVVQTISGHPEQVQVIGGNGIFRMKASFAGDDTYLAATDVFNRVKISKASQEANAPTIPDQTFPGSFTYAPTLSSGLTPVVEVDSKLSKGSGNTINTAATGIGHVTISHPGDANYLPLDPIDRPVNIVAVSDPMDTVLLTLANIIAKTSNSHWKDKILVSGSSGFYRYEIRWPETVVRNYSKYYLKTGFQVNNKFNKSNAEPNWKWQYRVSGAGAEVWTTAETVTGNILGEITHAITMNNAIQVRLVCDYYSPYARIQAIEVSGRNAT